MDKVFKEINYPSSRTYTIIYKIYNSDINTQGLIFGGDNIIDLLQFKKSVDEIIISYDKYNTYNDEQKYCINLKNPSLNNIQVKLDCCIIDYLYCYLDVLPFDYRHNLKLLIHELSEQLNQYHIQQFHLLNSNVKKFNKEIYQLLYILNILLIRQKKHRICHNIWMKYITPYLLTN